MAVLTACFPALVACQNGDSAAGSAQDGGVVDSRPTRGVPPKAISISHEDGPWLGGHAVPLGAAESSTAPVALSQQWRVSSGDTVASTIRRWAAIAGYTPVPKFSATEAWSFIVSEDFSGSFEDALAWLSAGFERQPLKPVIVLFANHTLDLVAKAAGAGTEPGAL